MTLAPPLDGYPTEAEGALISTVGHVRSLVAQLNSLPEESRREILNRVGHYATQDHPDTFVPQNIIEALPQQLRAVEGLREFFEEIRVKSPSQLTPMQRV